MLNRVIYRGAYRFEWRGERWAISASVTILDAVILAGLAAVVIAALVAAAFV